jgi:hypothetical protein
MVEGLTRFRVDISLDLEEALFKKGASFLDKHNCIEPAFNVELGIMPVPFGLITK